MGTGTLVYLQHSDEFLSNHLRLAPGVFRDAVRRLRARLTNLPYSVEDYLGILKQQGLVATAAELTGSAAEL